MGRSRVESGNRAGERVGLSRVESGDRVDSGDRAGERVGLSRVESGAE